MKPLSRRAKHGILLVMGITSLVRAFGQESKPVVLGLAPVEAQDPIERRAKDGTLIIPRKLPTRTPEELRMEQVLDQKLMPVAMQLVTTETVRTAQQNTVQPVLGSQSVDRNGRAAPLQPTSITRAPSPVLLRALLFAALRAKVSAESGTGPQTETPKTSQSGSPAAQDFLSTIQTLSGQNLADTTRELLQKGQTLIYSPAPLMSLSQPALGQASTFAFTQLPIQRMSWVWNEPENNWSASVPDSTLTQPSNFNVEGKENSVFTRLEYKWEMTGGALVWPESLSASGQWFNDGNPNGVPMSEFSNHYVQLNANGTTNVVSTFDRMVQQYEVQNRIRWKTQAGGTIQSWHMEGDTIRYMAPPPLPADGTLPRSTGDATRMITIGVASWQQIGAENKTSTGLIIPLGVQNGRVRADENTGVNGGDRVHLTVDGILGFRSTEGLYFYYVAPSFLRILFVPADGSPSQQLYPFQFPITFSRRGSLYVYLDRPDWEKWTPTFFRGGYAVALTIQRSPDSDQDGLTDYEETSGIPGWQSHILRYSDPHKIDSDGDTISDFDEVFGWEYTDRRSGQKSRAPDTDPSKPDEFYAREYLKNATFYKYKFRRNRDTVGYSAALNYIDDAGEQALRDAFTAARAVSRVANPPSPVVLDALNEKSTLQLMRAQDFLQQAYQTRFLATGLNAIANEREQLRLAVSAYDAGIRSFYGPPSQSPIDNTFSDFATLAKSLGASRKPWDTDAGEDPNEPQPYQELHKLAKLLGGRLEASVRDAELYQLQSDGLGGDVATKDKARATLIRGMASGLLGELVLQDQLPQEQFTSAPALETSYLHAQFKAAEARYSVVDRGFTNSLGLDPSFVRFAFNPENDPAAAVGDNPKNNFVVLKGQLDEPSSPLQLARQKETEAKSDQRAFENNAAQFEQARRNNQIVYDQQLNTYQLQFDDAKSQVNIAVAQLQKAQNELRNIYTRIQIEQERVAKKAGVRYEVGQQIAQVFLDTGEQLAANEYSLGEINATDAEIQGFIQAISSSSVSFGYPSGFSASMNPGQLIGGLINMSWGPTAARARAELAAANERIHALEKARVQMLNITLDNQLEQADSEAHVKGMLLETANASIDIRIRLLEMCESMARMQNLAQLIEDLRVKQHEADQEVKNLFGDPSYRLIRDETRESSQTLFERAREDVYLTAKAFEFETTWKSRALPKVFTARSADELETQVTDLDGDWARFLNLTSARVPTPVKLSLRDDILGFKWASVDPKTSQPVDPRVQFRNYLKSISTGNGKVFRIEFYGAMNEWSFPGRPSGLKAIWSIPRSVFDTKIQWINIKLVGQGGAGHLGDEAATVRIELGGMSWIRSSEGTEKPPADATEPWKYRENILRNTVVRFSPGPQGAMVNVLQPDLDRTVPVTVSAGEELKWWGLFGQSPVRKWAITLNLNESGNQDINIDALEDIEINMLLRSYDLP